MKRRDLERRIFLALDETLALVGSESDLTRVQVEAVLEALKVEFDRAVVVASRHQAQLTADRASGKG